MCLLVDGSLSLSSLLVVATKFFVSSEERKKIQILRTFKWTTIPYPNLPFFELHNIFSANWFSTFCSDLWDTKIIIVIGAGFTTCRNYLLISKAWKQRTKIRMGRLPFFVPADIQLIFFINNTDVTEWTTLLYVLWFIIISIFRRSESVLLICRYYHWDHG